MSKYGPNDIPPGETVPVGKMTLEQYRSWRGRCGGRSKSPKKLRAQRRNGSKPKPALSRYYALVKKIAEAGVDYTAEIKRLATADYPIDDAKAMQLLDAARKYRERNPL
jgi:hypothetical protein